MSSSYDSRPRKRHDLELKRRAIERLATESSTPKQIADDCGVSILTLLKWRREFAREMPGRDPEVSAQLERLREELAALRAERDRLLRAIAYLAGGN